MPVCTSMPAGRTAWMAWRTLATFRPPARMTGLVDDATSLRLIPQSWTLPVAPDAPSQPLIRTMGALVYDYPALTWEDMVRGSCCALRDALLALPTILTLTGQDFRRGQPGKGRERVPAAQEGKGGTLELDRHCECPTCLDDGPNRHRRFRLFQRRAAAADPPVLRRRCRRCAIRTGR
jgi:hypothetical protein